MEGDCRLNRKGPYAPKSGGKRFSSSIAPILVKPEPA